jgi:ABC-type bacteriocin/lantibiotic exporter with double-glycine peptidase domain
VTFGQLVIIGAGGYLVIKGHMSLGTLVAFVGLLPSFLQPITTLANVGQQVQRAAGAFDRMLEVLDEPIAIEERRTRRSFRACRTRSVSRGSASATSPAGRSCATSA